MPIQRKSAAFTLIELLVVIAIIAILAAILFPVFSQAKTAAKKTTSISNLKQIATASVMYNDSNDDTFPLAFVPGDPAGGYNWNRFIPVPASQQTNPVYRPAADVFVFNSIQPYMKNVNILQCPGGSTITTTATYGPTTQPAGLPSPTYTYNGLLNGYPGSAVTKPSDLMVYWHGHGKRSIYGYGYASPWLACNVDAQPCRYIPPATGCAGNGGASAYTTNSTKQGLDVFSGGIIASYVDTHAAFRKIGVNGTRDAKTDPRRDPWGSYRGQFASGRYFDKFGCHAYLFRPDLDFENWDTATYLAGGVDAGP